MTPLVDRTKFRAILKEIVLCLRQNLGVPGFAPLTAEPISFRPQNIILEDFRAVTREIEAERGAAPPETLISINFRNRAVTTRRFAAAGSS